MPCEGVDDIGGNVSERLKNKAAFCHTRVREDQSGRSFFIEDGCVCHQQIQVDGARSPPDIFAAVAPECAFDVE
jgi:hypothetical protein